MNEKELQNLINKVIIIKHETRTIEIKAAAFGCPSRLYDTLSSFSNQDDGGTIVFGIDEQNDYALCGVYDPQDLQKCINDQCLQMEPPIRPLLTVTSIDDKYFVSAEIPGIDVAQRPCFYKGRGRLKGSYIRVGDSDEPMSEYEIYCFESYRKNIQDELRIADKATTDILDKNLLEIYLQRIKQNRPNLMQMDNQRICELVGLMHDGKCTIASLMAFCHFPQLLYPQFSVTAVVIPGTRMGDIDGNDVRFKDNMRIEGNIQEMVEQSVNFVNRNMAHAIRFDPISGKRIDDVDYPIIAVREAILNALIHRDYSIYTQSIPVQIRMYDDRMEIINPGALYGRLSVENLGKTHGQTRNPVLISVLEAMGVCENRYSGIPTILREMEQNGKPEPVFVSQRGYFSISFSKGTISTQQMRDLKANEQLLEFLKEPKTRFEIAEFLGYDSVSYAIKTCVAPLIEKGIVEMSDPLHPRSKHQKYFTKTYGRTEN